METSVSRRIRIHDFVGTGARPVLRAVPALRARDKQRKRADRATPQAGLTLAALSGVGARRYPTATALHDAAGSITFRDLHRASRRLARLLLRLGVRPGERVAVLGTKDIQTVVAILAILQTGAAYVPIDPSLPDARRKFVLDDAAPRLVLGRASLYAAAEGRMFLETDHCTDMQSASVLDSVGYAELPEVLPEGVAYIMYTSGSTGYPKGVQIEHRSIEAFFRAHNARLQIGPGDRCMNTGPFHFDVSIMDVFLPLYFGASVVLTPELPMPKLLLRTLEAQRITHFYAVGTILALITGDGRRLSHYDLSALRVLQTGAEICSARVVNAWLERLPALTFLNSYGPTEVTVGCVSYLKPTPGPLTCQDVPIGALHEGTCALLLDEHGELLRDAHGGQGELLVSGPQLMRGYWNRAEEEQAAFLVVDGVRYYRTGDIVRRDAQGLIYYVGRRDDEVKIDGLRIHLNEVKRCLEAHALVASASVGTLLSRQQRRRVGAAIVTHAELDAARAELLLSELARELPPAAVPSALLLCDAFPRTATGKTDTRGCMEALQRGLSQHVARAFTLQGGDALPLAASPIIAAEASPSHA